MKRTESPGFRDYAALALISASALAYEILLLRVFSHTQWHHFASLAVSLAVLGFGVAGTMLVLMGNRPLKKKDGFFLSGTLIGAFGMLFAFVLTQWIHVRPLFAVWDGTELAKMLFLDFFAFVPFLGIGLAIGQVFMRWPEHTRPLYSANLIGSGIGALAAPLLLAFVHLELAMLLIPAATFAGALLFALTRSGLILPALLATTGLGIVGSLIGTGPPELPVSDFKKLAYLKDLPDSEVLARHPGLRAETTLIRSDSIRTSPGLSLSWTNAVPPNDALVIGSDHMVPLPRGRESLNPEHFKATLGALPFLLRPEGPVAIIGASEWLPLHADHAERTTWVLENRQILDAFESRGLLRGIDVRQEYPRSFLSARTESYSLLYFVEAFAGGDAVSEEYLLTTGALRQALARLSPEGVLAIPLQMHFPPRNSTRLMATAVEALRQDGIEEPASHLAVLRSMQAALLILSPDPLSSEKIATIREFSGQWGFDVCVLPGLEAHETNRYHQLPEPILYTAAAAILGGEESLPASADWYRTEAVSDARPYFWHSMKWDRVPALVREFGRQGLIWLDWSVLASVVKLLIAAVLAGLLIIAPLGRLQKSRPPVTRLRVCLYFAALGLGFLLLEMAVFQRILLHVSEPVIAASLVFSIFLVGAGIGSLTAPARRDTSAPPTLFLPILATALLAFVVLQLTAVALSGIPQWLRVACLAVSIAPMAWTLGRAFPWGMRQLDDDRHLIPWAWGINGFFSVLAAPLAALVSVQFGQPVTWLAAGACYSAAWLIAGGWVRQWSRH